MLCHACGFRNDDGAGDCRSCGAAISSGISDRQLQDTLDRLADRGDLLAPSKLDGVRTLAHPVFGC